MKYTSASCIYSWIVPIVVYLLLLLLLLLEFSEQCTDTDSDGRNQVHGKYYIISNNMFCIIHDLK